MEQSDGAAPVHFLAQLLTGPPSLWVDRILESAPMHGRSLGKDTHNPPKRLDGLPPLQLGSEANPPTRQLGNLIGNSNFQV